MISWASKGADSSEMRGTGEEIETLVRPAPGAGALGGLASFLSFSLGHCSRLPVTETCARVCILLE